MPLDVWMGARRILLTVGGLAYVFGLKRRSTRGKLAKKRP